MMVRRLPWRGLMVALRVCLPGLSQAFRMVRVRGFVCGGLTRLLSHLKATERIFPPRARSVARRLWALSVSVALTVPRRTLRRLVGASLAAPRHGGATTGLVGAESGGDRRWVV